MQITTYVPKSFENHAELREELDLLLNNKLNRIIDDSQVIKADVVLRKSGPHTKVRIDLKLGSIELQVVKKEKEAIKAVRVAAKAIKRLVLENTRPHTSYMKKEEFLMSHFDLGA